MNQGLTGAQMRESLLRSGEYADKNPDLAAAASASRVPKKSTKKKSSRKRASPQR